MQVLAGVSQHGGGTLEALFADAPHHPRRLQLLVVGDPGVDPLGGEGHEHVLAHDEAALLQRLHEQLAGGADVGGRGQHQRLPGPGVLDDRGARPAQDLEVGLQALVDRGGHADQHEVGRVERLDAAGQDETVPHQVTAEVTPLGLQQLGPTLADRCQTRTGYVDPDNPAARIAHRDRGGQSHIAETHHGHHGVTGLPGREDRSEGWNGLRQQLPLRGSDGQHL